MKKRILLLIFLFLTSVTGFCAIVPIGTTSQNEFTPDDITINTADIVRFVMGSTIHNAVEVNLSTWQAGGTTPISGGFEVGFGETKDITGLSVGTHYFVCQTHSSMGMRGKIEVNSLGVNDYQLAKNYRTFPNPATDFVNVKTEDNSLNLIYRIVDVNGRQMISGKSEEVNPAIDVSQFAPGIYFLQLGDDRRQILKVIKQ